MMTTMPTIDDRLVVLLRRDGKRRSSYRSGRSDRSAGGAPPMMLQGVAPQFNECTGKPNGMPCGPFPGMVCCAGICRFGPC
jgi:hypothetical protein